MEHVARVCTYLLEYGRPLLTDLGDEHAALAPAPDFKSAGWILGHLAVSGDYLRRQWGRPAITPRDWGRRFGPGSPVPTDPQDYPATAELRAAFLTAYRDLAAAAPRIPAGLLDAPNPFEPARGAFPTGRDFAVYPHDRAPRLSPRPARRLARRSRATRARFVRLTIVFRPIRGSYAARTQSAECRSSKTERETTVTC